MKQKTKNAFLHLSQMTGSRCRTCPTEAARVGEYLGPFRCCDKMFCDLVKEHNFVLGQTLPEPPNVGGIPFMGEKGCVVPPHQRPYCSGWVCPHHLKDHDFKKRYNRIIAKIKQDPEAPPMKVIMGDLLKGPGK